ncbi:MAG: hypothetical protein GBQ79_12155 [Halomonas sp.]|nr:hypothetical protein [Halomonas sp.]
MVMGKALGYAGAALLGALMLQGCSGPEEEAPAETVQAEETAAAEPVAEAEPIEPLEVEVSTSAQLLSDRRLMIAGQTNLPDGAQVQVVVERELSRVRWQARTQVREGQFEVGPLGTGSGLPDGGYVVRVQLSEAAVQPASVRARIGDLGEHLAGELVSQSRHGLGQVATYSRRLLIGSEPRRTRDQVDVFEDN